jgi:hypothetical protein
MFASVIPQMCGKRAAFDASSPVRRIILGRMELPDSAAKAANAGMDTDAD